MGLAESGRRHTGAVDVQVNGACTRQQQGRSAQGAERRRSELHVMGRYAASVLGGGLEHESTGFERGEASRGGSRWLLDGVTGYRVKV